MAEQPWFPIMEDRQSSYPHGPFRTVIEPQTSAQPISQHKKSAGDFPIPYTLFEYPSTGDRNRVTGERLKKVSLATLGKKEPGARLRIHHSRAKLPGGSAPAKQFQ
jgi:hypothetical protein